MTSVMRLAILPALLLCACTAKPFDCVDVGAAACADIPGVTGSVGWDDLAYDPERGRVIAATRGHGVVALVAVDSLEVTTIDGFGDAGSAAAAGGRVAVIDRAADEVVLVDPDSGERIAAATAHGPDYVRWAADVGELWVTEPGHGIEAFRIDADPPGLTSLGVFPTGGGPEGLVISAARHRGYVHGSSGVVIAVDTSTHAVSDRWVYACPSAHGIPALDDEDGLLLAGCGTGGEVHLLDLDDGGVDLGKHTVGSGAALMAYSPATGHLYARGDPGATIATLEPAVDMPLVGDLIGSESGHCLVADDSGHVWTGDEPGGRLLRIDDPVP